MKIIVLGSGTSTGVPLVGCRCPVCRSTDPHDCRTRSSLLICHASRKILIDSTTDLRSQMLREGIDRIDAVLFTHAHADHVNGIDDLRGFYFQHREMIPCYASPSTIEKLMKGFGYVFHRDDGASHPPILEANTINGSFELFGLKIIPVPLIHGAGVSCGFRVDNFAYLTDCSKIPASSLALLQGVATVIIDGLRWSPHPYHFNITGAIEALHSLHPKRIILTHLTHELFHAEGNRLPDGVEFAFDGMNFEL